MVESQALDVEVRAAAGVWGFKKGSGFVEVS